MNKDIFAIRAFPIFFTVIIFLMSIASHKQLLETIKNMDENIKLLWFFFISILCVYITARINQAENTSIAGWAVMTAMLIGIMLFYAVSWYNLDEVIQNIKKNPTLSFMASMPFFLIPMIIFWSLERNSKFTYSGAGLFALSLCGLIMMGLNSKEFVDDPNPKKGNLYRILAGVIPAALLLLTYMDRYFVHKGRHDQRAIVLWFLVAVTTVILKEFDALKQSDIPDNIWFGAISVLTMVAAYNIYKNPSKGDFSQYSRTIMYVSLISIVPIIALLSSEDEKRQKTGKIWWIWLLAFINITFLDGYMKFVATTKKASTTFDTVSNTVITLPVIVNSLLAAYTSYYGYVLTTDTFQDLTKTQLTFLTLGTYVAGFLTLILNTTNLEENILENFLVNMP
jgi:hypothetical protein|tara:strand:+ start:19994 stop:21181 length:1188 start_codon:yes stop_codon:yes gene_type:complete